MYWLQLYIQILRHGWQKFALLTAHHLGIISLNHVRTHFLLVKNCYNNRSCLEICVQRVFKTFLNRKKCKKSLQKTIKCPLTFIFLSDKNISFSLNCKMQRITYEAATNKHSNIYRCWALLNHPNHWMTVLVGHCNMQILHKRSKISSKHALRQLNIESHCHYPIKSYLLSENTLSP